MLLYIRYMKHFALLFDKVGEKSVMFDKKIIRKEGEDQLKLAL